MNIDEGMLAIMLAALVAVCKLSNKVSKLLACRELTLYAMDAQ